jgi:ABC-type amino acid transport substrate-binding protein
MGFPPSDIRVVANKDFLKQNPAVKRLAEVVELPLEDINAQNARMIDGEDDDEDIRRHAQEWIHKNRRKVDQWLKTARAGKDPIRKLTTRVRLDDEKQKEKTLRVATKRLEPFVIYQDKRYTGFSIELWEKIAESLGLEYELYGVNTIAKLLDEVERGAADVAIGGISITVKREQVVDFSHAFFETGLQIMVPEGSGSILGEVISKVFAVIFSRELFYGISIFFIILIIASHIIWALERRHNPQFPKRYPQGLWHSIWWAVVTVTTVGYGDKTPKGTFGRLFGVVWILAGYFVFAYFTASVTTTATVQELHGMIDSPRDLFGKQVATVEKSTAADYLAGQGIPAVKVEDVEQAYPLLESGKADAIVYDAPVLQHHASKTGKGKVKVVGLLFQEQNYGIALQVQSPYRKKINIALLKLIESGAYQEIIDKWFGS